MSTLAIKVVLVVALILVGFFVYQRLFDPTVTNADLIHGARELGEKVVEFSEEVVDSVKAGQSEPITSSQDDTLDQSARGWDWDDGSLVLLDDENTRSDNFLEGWSTPESTVDTLDRILSTYRDFNLLLEDDK